MKKVVIIEDQTAVREMIAHVVALEPGLEVIAEVGDGQGAIETCLDLKPDFVILDVMLPGLNGTEVLRRFSKQLKNTRVLIFSGHEDANLLRDLLEAGAHGFVGKSAPLSELRKGVQVVSSGDCYFGPEIAQMLREAMANPASFTRSAMNLLTAREKEILQLIAESYSTKEIASKLNISVKTAENHRTNLMRKLDLHDVAGLTRYAIRNGVIETPVSPTVSLQNNAF